jgi:2-hydroxycyclohexanecarboxyl-CoA dehydrogenase
MVGRKDVELRDALALITGAGGGIGRATALALAGHGARVLAVDIDGDAAEKTAAACAEHGPEAHGLACDVADAAAMTALAERVHDTWGPLDVLVNNAGVGLTGRWADMTIEDWAWIRGINLDGVVHGCLAFGPAMCERGHGHVVNVSSILGFWPHALVGAYTTTKAGVLALSQSLRADWGRRGVGVSAICPGMVNTAIVANGRTLGDWVEQKERTVEAFRKGRPPERVARAVVDAIRGDRPVALVGWDVKLAWLAHRLLPLPVAQLIARQGVS